ncbi:hypothetical protein K466DRAFT_570566 [Polyporus arcularius HHB13444]|uniref:Uncharacterized protein n=1 Tax=Polyporus arcularius HHB13444 TaxID=1314778 RepID=A0A5C3NR74_9APHY|nr:hypothetical protein K466DRAFT_570566 [Polyporus arcularius HHB13444]
MSSLRLEVSTCTQDHSTVADSRRARSPYGIEECAQPVFHMALLHHLEELQDAINSNDPNQHRQHQHVQYDHQTPQYSNAIMNVPQQYPPMMPAMSFHDTALRMQRLEQDFAHLRQVVAEQSVEIAELKRRNVRGGKIAELEDLLKDAVNPTLSLHKGEEPGLDCPRRQEDFLRCRFFEDDAYNDYLKSKQGITSVGQEATKRGRPRKGDENPETFAYIENVDGTTADVAYYRKARRACREFIDGCEAIGIPCPRTWSKVDARIQNLFYVFLRAMLPLFQLCYNNSKGNRLMSGCYYDLVHRANATKLKQESQKGKKAGKRTGKKEAFADLDEAEYTIEEDGNPLARNDITQDESDIEVDSNLNSTKDEDLGNATDNTEDLLRSDSEDEGDAESRVSKKDTSQGKKRVRENEVTSNLAKKMRTLTASLQANVAIVPSVSAKGKEKERPPVPAFTDNSMDLLNEEPPPDLFVPQQRLRKPVPKPAGRKSKAAVSKAAPLVEATTADDSAATLAADAPPTTSTVPTPSALSALSAPPIAGPSGSRHDDIAPLDDARKRPPRAASSWPPDDLMTGAMWNYAREWFAKTKGTLQDFQAHYKALCPKEKQRQRAQYTKDHKMKPTL